MAKVEQRKEPAQLAERNAQCGFLSEAHDNGFTSTLLAVTRPQARDKKTPKHMFFGRRCNLQNDLPLVSVTPVFPPFRYWRSLPQLCRCVAAVADICLQLQSMQFALTTLFLKLLKRGTRCCTLVYAAVKLFETCNCKTTRSLLFSSSKNRTHFCRCNVYFVAAKLATVFPAVKSQVVAVKCSFAAAANLCFGAETAHSVATNVYRCNTRLVAPTPQASLSSRTITS